MGGGGGLGQAARLVGGLVWVGLGQAVRPVGGLVWVGQAAQPVRGPELAVTGAINPWVWSSTLLQA